MDTRDKEVLLENVLLPRTRALLGCFHRDDPLGRPRKAKVAGSNPVFRLRFGPADLAGLRVPGQELVRPCARSC